MKHSPSNYFKVIFLSFFVLTMLFPSLSFGQTSDSLIWLKVNESITSSSTVDDLGIGVAISDDAQRFAVGNRLFDNENAPFGSHTSAGLVRILSDDSFSFINYGDSIIGQSTGEQLGGYLLFSANGQRLLAQGDTRTRLYEFNQADSTWNQITSWVISKSSISNTIHNYAMAMSASGDTVAISEPGFDVTGFNNEGMVRVFVIEDGSWTELGDRFFGESGDNLGTSLALSADGSTLAIGTERIDGTFAEEGRIRVYSFDGTDWVQKGSDLVGDGLGYHFGASVDLTPDGETLIGGSPEYSEIVTNRGSIKVYNYDGSDWQQVGSTIEGQATKYNFGAQVRISADGKTFAASAPGEFSSSNPGYVRVFRLFEGENDWIQLGLNVFGDVTNTVEDFGFSLDFSSDGETFIAGAPDAHDGGRVDVYEMIRELDPPSLVTPENGATIAINSTFEWQVRHKTEVLTVFHLSTQTDYSDTIYVKDFLTDAFSMSLIDTLNTGQTYYWRVKQYVTDYPNFESEWSESSFTVAPIEIPQVITPNESVFEPQFTLDWVEESNPEDFYFDFHLSSQLNFGDTVLLEENFTSNSISVELTDTLSLGNYYWRIRRKAIEDDRKVSDWNNQSFTIDIDGVSLLSPSNASVQELPFTFLWSSDSLENDSYGYDFQLSNTSDFQDTILFNSGSADTTYIVNQSDSLILGTEYFWRARRRAYVNATYGSDWEQASVSFETPGVVSIYPEDDTVLELPATLAWQPLSNNRDYDFEVQISLSESFVDTLLYEQGVQDTTLIVDFDFAREIGETYFWRARRVGTENSTYVSEWSTIQSFSTKIDAPEVEGPKGDTIELPYSFTWLPDTLDAFYDYNLVIYSDEELSDSLIVYTINNGTSQTIGQSDGEFLFRSDSTFYWNLVRYANQNDTLIGEPTPTYSFRIKVDNAAILSPNMGDTINPVFTRYVWDESNLSNTTDYSYEIRIADTLDFENPIYRREPVFSNHSLEPVIQADTSKLYYWGIRRFARGNTFLISDFAADSMMFQVEAPFLFGPEEGAEIILGETPVTLQWFENNGGDPSLDYYLQVSEFRNFSNPIVDQKVEGGFFTFDNTDLETNETYYWRVRVAWNQGGAAPEFHMSSRWSTSSFFVYPEYIRLIPDSVFVVEPNYVNVMLHALDQENEGITVLERDDFELLENNSPISPTESRYQVSKLDQIPSNLQTVLMLDNSLSIGEENLDSIKSAARSFIRSKAENQEVSIFVFADQVENAIDFTTDTTELITAIDNIALTRFSGTDLYSATLTGLEVMENKFSLTKIQQSFMLLFTDGKDLAGRATLDSVLTARGNKQIYAVGVKLNEADFDEPTLRLIGNAGTIVDEGFSELIARFEEVQENSLTFSNSFYWLNYASSRRAGATDLTAQMIENTNVNEDRRIVTTFDADGFYSAPIDIVVDGSAEEPLGVDTIRMAGDATLKVKIESVFAYAAYPFSFQISDPSRFQIAPDLENAFNYDFYADGVAEDTIRLTITDTVQQTLNLEKTLIVIYSERETNFNEAPEIENQTFSIAENSSAETVIGTIVASDPEGDPLSYTIVSGNESGAFDLDMSTGELTVLNESALDFETTPTFILTVEVADTEPKSASAEIIINLTDVEENEAPVFDAQTFSVDEHSPIGTVVGVLVASDPENEELSFDIVSGNESGLFSLESTSGNLTVANSENLDFEVVQQVVLQVSASDGVLQTEASITVDLIDIDENVNQAPVINDQAFSILLSVSNGDLVGTVNASDPNGDELTYSITDGNGEGIYAIDENSGELTINDNSNLVETTYVLTVEVSDGELNASGQVTIDVTDENFAPVVEDQTFNLFETAGNGDEVGTVVASDANGDALSFSITDGNTSGIFSIASSTGVISVANESALAIDVYNLTVVVSDSELSDQATITINVAEVNDPPSIADQTFTIDENSAAGSEVGTVSASDPENDPLFFAISTGNETGSFEINESSGVITVLSSSALDFETTPTFQLGVSVSDDFNSSSATITINLNDVEDSGQLPPQIENQTFNVDENSPNGTVIGTVLATDPENNTIFFTIVSGNDNGEFGISLNEGVLTVENSSELDFEATPLFDLVVEASDGDKLNTAIITINLNDLDDNDPPQIENQMFDVDENSANGTAIGTVVATDPDGDPITYAIAEGNTNGAFSIDENSGSLSVANSSELDFETNPTFSLTVQVSDGSLSATAEITVTLNDINENTAPTINDQTFQVVENSPTGTVVGTVAASDVENDAISFTIIGGNELNGFNIDTNSGEITVSDSNALDFETTPTFSLTVEASDGDQAADAVITINLIDENESSNTAPTINDQTFQVVENSSTGTVVGTVAASDAENDAISFTIIGGNELNGFNIDTNSGEITVSDSNALDFETTPTFSLTIEASDGDMSADAVITINLIDENESSNTAPTINDQTFQLDENSENGTIVGTVVATDAESNAIFYSIVTGNELSGFAIGATNGELFVTDSEVMDFETNPTFSLTVEATDGDKSSTGTITINLNDIENEEVLSVAELKSVSVYPNPFTDVLHISLEHPAFISISDLSGKVVMESDYQKGYQEILLQNIPTGIYLIKLRFEDGSQKIVKTVKEE